MKIGLVAGGQITALSPKCCQIYDKKFIVISIAHYGLLNPELKIKHLPMLSVGTLAPFVAPGC